MHNHRENEKACLEWSWNGVHSGFFMNGACFSFLGRVGDSKTKDDLTVFETLPNGKVGTVVGLLLSSSGNIEGSAVSGLRSEENYSFHLLPERYLEHSEPRGCGEAPAA